MRLVVAVYLRVEPDQAHQEGGAGTGVPEYKELFQWEEIFGFGDLLRRDRRDIGLNY
jgi:hypothetical protein